MIELRLNEDYGKWVGKFVFYQQPHMKEAEQGVIVNIDSVPKYIHVRFGADRHAKACRLVDLYWPPNFFGI